MFRGISKHGPMRPDFVLVVDIGSWLEALRPKGSSGHVCSLSEQLSEVVAEVLMRVTASRKD